MITVEITKNSITANGHASEGNALICNSVSVLLWALAISLQKAQAFDLYEEEDDGYQHITYTPTEKTAPIFNGVVECFKQMGKQFPNDINVLIKK